MKGDVENIVSWGLPVLIERTAEKYDLDPELVAAVILQESSGEVSAGRYERAFYRRYLAGKGRKKLLGFVPQGVTLETERVWRSQSWGLMQIMGQTARENGFKEKWLCDLKDPWHNIEMGCKLLRKWLGSDSSNDTEAVKRALLRYNGGANKHYPVEVLKKKERANEILNPS